VERARRIGFLSGAELARRAVRAAMRASSPSPPIAAARRRALLKRSIPTLIVIFLWSWRRSASSPCSTGATISSATPKAMLALSAGELVNAMMLLPDEQHRHAGGSRDVLERTVDHGGMGAGSRWGHRWRFQGLRDCAPCAEAAGHRNSGSEDQTRVWLATVLGSGGVRRLDDDLEIAIVTASANRPPMASMIDSPLEDVAACPGVRCCRPAKASSR